METLKEILHYLLIFGGVMAGILVLYIIYVIAVITWLYYNLPIEDNDRDERLHL
ncbi:hypothetical protein [Mucilaginibacter endophyticus]|uniref:hypothetical protein n=1 Tax=Mucilaginibacter endophyticus TaxID=2675003 RepID=UPI0012B16376|nr:hypothetical protein [Mucilaginibacter endophyticus]